MVRLRAARAEHARLTGHEPTQEDDHPQQGKRFSVQKYKLRSSALYKSTSTLADPCISRKCRRPHTHGCSHVLFITFETLPLAQPGVRLGSSLTVHLPPNQILICKARVQRGLGRVACSKKLGKRVILVTCSEGKDGFLTLRKHVMRCDGSRQKHVQEKTSMLMKTQVSRCRQCSSGAMRS